MPSSNLNARLNFDQGRDAFAKAKYNEASEFFRAAVETDPRFVEAHRHLADTYGKLGYAHRAKKAWEALLRITTDPAEQAEIQSRIAQANQGAGG
ncbi:MAG: tetratricopeptide repeat protein [bacterium]|nr:tetratricopeptide repeat protein [bacterium]